ncbi:MULTISPECIES: hypothetical protein [Streptomyces]|uniref:TPM domain-containing protein n=1 Tax=Streptomyces ramulosus TaxID=47762 RepID=A0ABW1FIZ6_9ACTN
MRNEGVGAVRRGALMLVTGWLAVLLSGAPAMAQPSPPPPGQPASGRPVAGPSAPGRAAEALAAKAPAATPSVPSGPSGPDVDRSGQAFLAEQLRRDPVYISDQVPREAPRSSAPVFAAQAARLRVPVYVMVLPDTALGADGAGFLAGVHDRLGRDGLYVALSGPGMPDVQAYGVAVPGARDAARATLYELPYDATAREIFQHFVDVLVSGRAHERAEAGRIASEHGAVVPRLHPDTTERENQSFVTGIAVAGIPLSVVLVGLYVRRRLRLRRARGGAPVPGPRTARGPAAPSLRKPGDAPDEKHGGRTPGRAPQGGGKRTDTTAATRRFAGLRRPPRAVAVLLIVAVALGGGLALTAARLFDDRSYAADAVPTPADMRARIERVTAGLRHDPLYTDPESEPVLTAAERTRLHERLTALDVPVLVVAVPSLTDDESGGDEEIFVHTLRQRLGRDALFVLADPLTDTLSVVNDGAPVNAYALPDSHFRLPERGDTRTLGDRIDAVLRDVARAPRDTTATRPYDPGTADDPVAEKVLPSVFAADFAPGLMIGAFLAGLLLGLVAAVRALVGAAWRRRTAGGRAPGGVPVAAEAPAEPSLAWLRRTARQEADALTAALDAHDALPEPAHRRAWECLDAAALLIDGDGDGRVDADATPSSLACAVALARAGRTAVAESAAPERLCHRNPLHGAAQGTRRISPLSGGRPRPLPVCGRCRAVPAPVLRLGPAADSGRAQRVPYPELPGPLASLATGTRIDQLTRDVREYFGVH